MTFGILLILFMLLSSFVEKKTLALILIVVLPFLFIIVFFYFFKIPTVKINKIKRMINREVIFVGRFLIVELESGVPLFNAIKNVSRNFEVVGAYFQEIVEKVSVGTTLEKAINEAVDMVPSNSLRRMLWQLSNSITTGSDVVSPLNNVIETLTREQQIEVAEYGRKLNPLAMFYMLIAVVVPSLGITLLTIITVFIGLKLSLSILMMIVGLLGFMQFMFVAIINSGRPSIEF
ncbi:type II secretion system F family protein [Candidatus Woesearchaeota archaeon]|nr:type II secretion system F family protein [Candidatus Woesearchaeota archaeon]